MPVSHPGASAQENEEKVTRPLEEQLRTLSGVQEIESTSREDRATIFIQFEANSDMDLAKAEVRDRMERARGQLPETVEDVGIFSWDGSQMPILFVAILHPGDSDRTDFLVESVIQRRLEAVDGAGLIEIWGILDDAVRILLNEDRVAAANLDLGSLIRRLSSDNFAMPMGVVEDGGTRVLMRSDMRFSSLDEIRSYPVGDGRTIGDLAEVVESKSVGNRLYRIDGSYSYYAEIQKDSQANVVATCDRMLEAIAELESERQDSEAAACGVTTESVGVLLENVQRMTRESSCRDEISMDCSDRGVLNPHRIVRTQPPVDFEHRLKVLKVLRSDRSCR